MHNFVLYLKQRMHIITQLAGYITSTIHVRRFVISITQTDLIYEMLER